MQSTHVVLLGILFGLTSPSLSFGQTNGNVGPQVEEATTASIMRVWQAARDSEPFTSIRGAFNLAAPDSHHWSTTSQVPGSESCVIVGAGASENRQYGYGCRFADSVEVYQRIVGEVGWGLGSKFVPDDVGQGANQVYFTDPTMPGWRLIVSKRSGFVSIRMVPDAWAKLDPVAFFPPDNPEARKDCVDFQGKVKAQIQERADKQREFMQIQNDLGRLQGDYQRALNDLQNAQAARAAAAAGANSQNWGGVFNSWVKAAGDWQVPAKQNVVNSVQMVVQQKQQELQRVQTSMSFMPALEPPAGCPSAGVRFEPARP